MTVDYTAKANADLNLIWLFNADRYGVTHANGYVDFLMDSIDRLATTYTWGTRVPHRSDLQFVRLRRRHRGHHHIAVYTVAGSVVRVLHLFHSAQDWQRRLTSD